MSLVAGVEVDSVFMFMSVPAGGLRFRSEYVDILQIFESASEVVSWIGGSSSEAGSSPELGCATTWASAPASGSISSWASFDESFKEAGPPLFRRFCGGGG